MKNEARICPFARRRRGRHARRRGPARHEQERGERALQRLENEVRRLVPDRGLSPLLFLKNSEFLKLII